VRIDFVTTFGVVAGFPSFPEATLARDLTALGHSVRALTYYAKSSRMIDAHHERIDGTEVYRLRRKGFLAPGALGWPLRDPPDVAHLHHLSNRLTALALPAYHARRVPVLFAPYGILHDPVLVADTDRPFAAPLHRERISRSLLRSVRVQGARRGGFVWAMHRPLFAADAIHAMSRHEKEVLIELGVPAERIHFIPLGIDRTLLESPNPPANGGSPLGSTEPRTPNPTVLFLGQTKYRKGWDVLMRAIPRVRAAIPEARFIFAGHTARDQADFDTLVDELGVRDALVLPGRVSEAEKVRLLRSAWVLALPARYEGFGIPLVEAMMVGTPVVTTDVPACNEIVQDGETGLVVPPDDPDALGSAITRLLEGGSLRTRLGAAGQRHALAEYDGPVIAQQFLALYTALVGGRC
jgi:glycosyltransferase involved in cell wall biosynthesis